MKNKFSFLMTFAVIFLVTILVASPVSAQIADGTYKVNYEMKEAGSANTSIADGYFTKPATLIVENGVQYIQLTVTGSNYIKSLSTPAGSVSIVSENKANQTRVVKFKVSGDLSKPLNMNMHIVVPDMYDMTHTARAVFNVSGLPQASSTVEQKAEKSGVETNSDAAANTVENPKTGDDSPIGMYVLLMLGSAIALFAIRKFGPVRN
ncbi:NEAT domain-containing protein [Sporosarcina sp. Marseille-Q4063]|uniref:NEAT domain-containing protein n=1 Tax=Sporosarcina sp. Marseille-Q4063 TaxID=2810514 RepID=UPI001BAF4D67|nr:NEAT domain-containing protein [Sporosarcina sp. Marseille-Q4063]QUW24041.1 NEAT domain-containing protein [Sporosarcina sp. Marseille-Q4063]